MPKMATAVPITLEVHPLAPAIDPAQIVSSVAQASRAGSRTQAQVSLGLGLAEIVVGAFLRRPA